ncbi:putative integral membrane protein [Encephalitozoon intestinalis ATCC 50506]|uniref:Integral membrane protein n=1 Tax=Encephalitozoon intestinalis (strain ATCC 50506) TaxID=876142 RepID=E0S7W8_ENCIT|nr:putative integral membrane protein [Encephalitozoon intestinalis ATCC 50506]ADM11803.1 putative integral membrane protein [Encephalitozoon intestinalis ATCC 50506]UTX45552.1 calcium-dependent ion channel protein [Encephalitozoon intestinalis]
MADADKENMGKAVEKPPLKGADNAVLTNIVSQGFITVCILIVYIIFRKRARWLYSPNVKDRPCHPCYNYTGFLSWIIPVVTVSDTILLSIIGLDAFMMLQTLKMLYRILFVLSFFVIPSLGYLFWTNQRENVENSDQWLVRLSLGSLDPKSESYGFIIPVVYLISAFIMYSIFIYYKRYIVLRQAYLRNPAIMTSIITLKRLSNNLGSAEKSTEYVNLPNRTLILSRLPSYVNNDIDLFEFIDSLGVGEIDDCVLVYDTNTLQSLYSEKDSYIYNIEKEINEKFAKMQDWSEKNQEACAESISGFKESILKTVEEANIEGVFDSSQKRQLIVLFLDGAKQFENTLKEDIPKVNFYLEKLNNVNGRISKEKEIIKNEEARNKDVRIVELVSHNNTLFLQGDISQDASFFSFHHILNYSNYKMYFTLDLPSKTKRGFVTFKDQRSANIVKQSQIGSRIFSVASEDAPAPNDVIWENITNSEVENYMYSVFGAVFFILFIILFSSIVANIVTLLVSTEMFRENKLISSFLDKHETITDSLRGILFPLIYNSMMVFVPTIITALVNMEGIYSYSTFQQKLMDKLSNFLFFNGFVSVFFASSFYRLFADVLFRNERIYNVIKAFSNESLESSVFFANTIIQRTLVGTALTLLKPAPLLINYIIFPFTGRKTRRERFDAEFSPPFDFGTIFPSCLTVFSMSIVYAVICPPILLLGAFFYLCNYLTFKSEFLYASRNQYESGGGYWDSACQNIMFSLIFFQVATFAKMSSDKRFYLSMFLLPIILITFIFRSSLKKMFYKSCHFYPLNIKEEEYLDTFTERVLVERVNLLESWSEMGGGPDVDILPLSELGIKDTKEIEKESYYNDPNTAKSNSSLILPEHFFKTVWFLVNNDRNNLFGLRTE